MQHNPGLGCVNEGLGRAGRGRANDGHLRWALRNMPDGRRAFANGRLDGVTDDVMLNGLSGLHGYDDPLLGELAFLKKLGKKLKKGVKKIGGHIKKYVAPAVVGFVTGGPAGAFVGAASAKIENDAAKKAAKAQAAADAQAQAEYDAQVKAQQEAGAATARAAVARPAVMPATYAALPPAATGASLVPNAYAPTGTQAYEATPAQTGSDITAMLKKNWPIVAGVGGLTLVLLAARK